MTKEDKESHVERIKARTGELDAEASVVELPFDEFDRSNCGRYCGHPTGAENGTGLLVFGYRAESPARQTSLARLARAPLVWLPCRITRPPNCRGYG